VPGAVVCAGSALLVLPGGTRCRARGRRINGRLRCLRRGVGGAGAGQQPARHEGACDDDDEHQQPAEPVDPLRHPAHRLTLTRDPGTPREPLRGGIGAHHPDVCQKGGPAPPPVVRALVGVSARLGSGQQAASVEQITGELPLL
jgi:hypothetical protein